MVEGKKSEIKSLKIQNFRHQFIDTEISATIFLEIPEIRKSRRLEVGGVNFDTKSLEIATSDSDD